MLENGRENATLRKLLRLLDGLKQTRTGRVLYGHIEQMLEEYEADRAETEQSYASLTCLLLDAYSTHLSGDSPLLAQIKMLQMRLTPPLSQAEINVLHRYVENFADHITQLEAFNAPKVERALAPLLREFGFTSSVGLDQRVTPDMRRPPAGGNIHFLRGTTLGREAVCGNTPEGAEPGEWRSALANKISEAVVSNERFSDFLEAELATLRELDEVDNFELRKNGFLDEIEQVLQGHRHFMQHFYHISNYMALVETDSERLNAELNRAMILSLTDELTGLSNRRAFMQRLEDEISRAQRYGNSLSLALIDIDNFKLVNDHHGHTVGDSVLRAYAQNVLTTFRHHDMVARYGGEEFAVIFPNTSADGAMRALEKVQQRTNQCPLELEDVDIKLPTFSAGLAVYKNGETINDLINRADEALYRAKGQGRRRIELADAEAAAG